MKGCEDVRNGSVEIHNEVKGEGSFSCERKIDKRAGCIPCAGRIKIALDKCIVDGRQKRTQVRVLLLKMKWSIRQDDGSFVNGSVDPVVVNVREGSRSCQACAPELTDKRRESIRYRCTLGPCAHQRRIVRKRRLCRHFPPVTIGKSGIVDDPDVAGHRDPPGHAPPCGLVHHYTAKAELTCSTWLNKLT